MSRLHIEAHVINRIGWLRASILGANDGIVSTASLIAGVAAAGASQSNILVTGIAGLVAGAMSMAAGEYVSVSSQGEAEKADVARETAELETQPEFEREELIGIYEKRGLDRDLAEKVADKLMASNALEAHLRDELGLTSEMSARPIQAALASAAAFAAGAALPLILVPLFPGPSLTWIVSGASLLFLAILGVVGAKAGGAPVGKGVLRVTFWGAVAMAATAAIGSLFGTTVG
ncbi:VIT family protein [uncultured Sphingorhabdus sp.]|uniref:VIT1/CCC1 transporter family protein n=1 Tax=uncultured Sphingorhabdus sp. TaxID=1686106 RepID=UPI0026364C70|nr:VIT family protein [uncultured Sphingorhabdus sp.]HMS21295.1 VIT family protein [Sphingorhabdus sp.]